MDFHSLARKELQALCKKNKIPANITNVAMADALTALETVEGLEEFLNQSQSQEKAVPESPSVPHTATRTSTRRKPIQEEPETAQPTTRTRGRTRRAIDQDLDQENENVNVVETPAMPASRRRGPAGSASRKMEAQVIMVETPAVHTGRRRTQVVSDRKKVEGSVQQGVYSTRRSVRLLEKCMADLNLKEGGVPEPVKMDALDGTEEKDVPGNLEKTNDSSSGESFIEVPMIEKKLKDDVQEKDKCDNGLDVCDQVTQESDHLDNVPVLDAKDDSIGETDELDRMGSVDVQVTELTPESENPFANVCDEVSTKDHKADDSGDAQVLVSESLNETENASAEVMETENASEEVMETENVPDECSPKVAAEVLLEEEDLELPFDSDSWETDSDHSVNESNDVNVSPGVTNNIDSDFQKSVTDKDAEEVVGVEKESCTHGSENSHVEMEESAFAGLVELTEGEVVISHEDNSPKFVRKTSLSEIDLISEDKAVAYAVDVERKKEMPSQEYDFASNLPPLPDSPTSGEKKESEKDMIDVHEMPSQEYDFAANLPPLPDSPTSGEKMSPCHPVSGSKILFTTQMSPLGANTIATLFPRPTQSTPVRSSSKKQSTDQPADNKENVDTSEMKVEPTKDKVKKKKNLIDVDSLNEKSLRELTKMLKKVQIQNKKNKNDEDEQFPTKAQVGKTRPALQKLPENVMLPEK